MRILQVDIDGKRLELHPYISIVAGLTDATREHLVAVLSGVIAGRAAGAAGLVEAHGVLLDLTAENLDLLDMTSSAVAVDPIVRADDLPGASLAPAARQRVDLARQRALVDESLRRAESTATRADAAFAASREALEALGAPAPETAVSLAEPRAAVETRRAQREAAERALADAQAELDEATAAERAAHAAIGEAHAQRNDAPRVEAATDALERAREGRDPFAAAALEAARERVSELERELAAAEAGKAADANAARVVEDARAARIAELEARRDALQASLRSLDAVDPFPVEVALAQAESDESVERVPSREAQSLADEWVDLQARITAGAPAAGDDPRALATARRRLDEARLALFEAERAVRLPDISREDAEALEDAHEKVLGLQSKSDRRFGGGKTRSKLDEAQEAEQALLDRFGFLSYADFVMGTSILQVDPGKELNLESARDELAAAEDELTRLEKGVDAELTQAELRNQQRVLRSRVVELLGRDPGNDVEWALRQVRVTNQEHGSRFDRLRDALERAGVVVADADAAGTQLIAVARVWLDEQQMTASERTRVESELAATEAELRAGREAEDDSSALRTDSAERRRRIEARLDDALAELEDARQRVELHAAAEIAMAHAKVDLEAAMADDDDIGAAVAALEQRAADAATAVRDARAAYIAADTTLLDARRAESDAVVELAALTEQLEQTGQLIDRAAREAAVEVAQSAADEARVEVTRLRADAAALDQRMAALPEPSAEDAEIDVDASIEELEWYLLSRVAAQRAVSYAGSVPLILDDALGDISAEALDHVLERLERMTSAVQVIVLSDDAEVAQWAERAGPDRAAIVTLEALTAA